MDKSLDKRSLMFWVSIQSDRENIFDQFFNNSKVLNYLKILKNDENCVFQQNNSPVYKSEIVSNFFRVYEQEVLEYSALRTVLNLKVY